MYYIFYFTFIFILKNCFLETSKVDRYFNHTSIYVEEIYLFVHDFD